MAQKFNWGAALTTLGGGLGDYAEQKRREAAMRMLREQQVADLADQRAYDDQRWLERLNITDPVIPVPKDIREYVGLPDVAAPFAVPIPGAPNAIGGPPAPTLARTSAVGNWQNMMPAAPKPEAKTYTWRDKDTGQEVTGDVDTFLRYTRKEKERPNNTDRLMQFTYPTADWVDPAVRGTSVTVPASQYASLTNEFYGRYGGGGGGLPNPAKVTGDWYGGWVEKGDYDEKTGAAAPYRYPYSGRGRVRDPARQGACAAQFEPCAADGY